MTIKKNILTINILVIVLFISVVLTFFVKKITTPREYSMQDYLNNGLFLFDSPKPISDFIFYSAFILIFGLLNTGNIVISCLLLFSYICTGTTFLAQAIVQPKLDLIQKDENLDIDIPKTFYYSAGLIEGAETILFMLLCLLFPNLYFFFGLIFTILCLLTALSRIIIFYRSNRFY